MQFYLSTISDVNYEWDDEKSKERISYSHVVGPYAKKYNLGLELAEFCIASNFENPNNVNDFFYENVNDYTSKLIVHSPFNELFPHAINQDIVNVAEITYSRTYRLCENIGATKMVVHANYLSDYYFPSWFKEKQIDFWEKFLSNNSGKCIIVLENVLEDDPDLILDIVKQVDNERLKICLDLGHANVRPKFSVYDWIEKCAPYISHLHIHNNNGISKETGFAGASDLHNGLGNGIIDYKKALDMIQDLVPGNPSLTIESNEIAESIDWLQENHFL